MLWDLEAVNFAQVIVTGIVTVLGAFFGSYVMWKLVGPGVIKSGANGVFGPALIKWLFAPSIDTGEKVQVKHTKADGTEVTKEEKEIVAPAQFIATQMARVIQGMMLSKLGVDGRKKAVLVGDIQAQLADPDSPFAGLVGFLSPKARERALKDGDYIPILLDMLVSSPQARELVGKAINKFKGQSSSGALESVGGVGGKTW